MKLNKPFSNKEYADLAVYCNEHGMLIEDKGDYLEAVNPPEPTDEQKAAEARAERDRMIDAFDWRVSRNNDEREFGLTETDNRELLLKYREYLRNYPETEGWYENPPKDFSTWKEMLTEEE